MLECSPFLLFDGTCAEAMTFYQSCFGGELRLTRLGDSPMKDQLPPEKHDRIINAYLSREGFEISATDWMSAPTYEPIQGNTCSVFVTSDSTDEVRQIFAKLSDGAERERFQELHELPIGLYGQLCDRFGVNWIFLAQQA